MLLVSEDWYFWTHRLRLAQQAVERGYRVTLVTRCSRHCAPIRACGIDVVDFDIGRTGTNPAKDLKSLFSLVRLIRGRRPDIVYSVALKPVLLGGLAAWAAGVKTRFAALGGLGFLFGGVATRNFPLRLLVTGALRLLLAGDDVIVQNSADLRVLMDQAKVPESRLHLIPGAGVDLERFHPVPEPTDGPIRLALVARMLWAKGVAETVEATCLLRQRGLDVVLDLVGEPDAANPGCIDSVQLRRWAALPGVQWLGRCDAVEDVWAASHIAVLPSYYREGLPKALMEAAACGRPIVTTDAPGCRDAIIIGESGVLVPERQPVALADALEGLVRDGALRKAMGQRARRDAEDRFSDTSINTRILDLCDQALGRGARRPGD
ncbi:MAG: glycosyltransferase family 4 protein [Thiohalocapsa sp.]